MSIYEKTLPIGSLILNISPDEHNKSCTPYFIIFNVRRLFFKSSSNNLGTCFKFSLIFITESPFSVKLFFILLSQNKIIVGIKC